jgi:hypothetical protein
MRISDGTVRAQFVGEPGLSIFFTTCKKGTGRERGKILLPERLDLDIF